MEAFERGILWSCWNVKIYKVYQAPKHRSVLAELTQDR